MSTRLTFTDVQSRAAEVEAVAAQREHDADVRQRLIAAGVLRPRHLNTPGEASPRTPPTRPVFRIDPRGTGEAARVIARREPHTAEEIAARDDALGTATRGRLEAIAAKRRSNGKL